MNWIEQHKAVLLTILISGIITFAMFSINISQKLPAVAETFIDITPPDSEEQKRIEEFLNTTKISDKAFSEDASFKELMKNFKSVPADDFERTINKTTSKTPSDQLGTSKTAYSTENFALNDAERERYKRLKKSLQQSVIADHSKVESSFIYSLKNRTLLYHDTPRYLCEEGGKVIVNVIVNTNGTVKECYINQATTTTNPCLLNSAIAYAKEVVFNPSTVANQLGSVTYYFRPKLPE